MESLVDTPSSLEKIVGIDVSQKGLIRAAKVCYHGAYDILVLNLRPLPFSVYVIDEVDYCQE